MPLLDEHCWCEKYVSASELAGPTLAVFLDRDGVIIEEKHYIREPDQVELCNGARDTLKYLHDRNIPVVVVTNQSGISRGMFDWKDFERVHERMLDLLGMDRPFIAAYANSYHPSDKNGTWRKPNPGMFLQATSDFNISLEDSFMVGDKLVDLEAAATAGVKRLVHVKTGHGVKELPKVVERFPEAELIESIAQFKITL